ncbi:hypothetical protein [Streptomyces sp. BE133]|uniref:hypothetical protein n=1 Tax=Streptomyces sp. BE133 TaxID=3002523 RepID=UPI002E76F2BE|nr:hypothetical protein [Streptomyces sp. BE133]MEE1812728.1 hypothetical protein [Streptomyces sp. BE133]
MVDIKNKQLQEAITVLGKNVARDGEAIRAAALGIHTVAMDTARVAEQISGLGVDAASVAETRELAKMMTGVSEASAAYAAAADNTTRAATAAVDQARASHDGIHEAVNRSPVDVSGLNRQWVTPE